MSNHVENLLILVSAITSHISISAFSSLVFVLVGITSFTVGRNICAIAAGIKEYNSIIKKKKKKHGKAVLLLKDKLNTIKVLRV